MATKRPYSYDEANASQKPQQKIITDSETNGVKTIPTTYFAKSSDLTSLEARVTAIENFLNGKTFVTADN